MSGEDTKEVGVHPLPGSEKGTGENPIKLQPGEKVPHPSDVTSNTIESTVRTDKEAYEADASAPINATVQSAAPQSTTAELASAVPLEKDRVDKDVPGVVRRSFEEAHKSPEAAGDHESVEEKKDVEKELLNKVSPDESKGTPAPSAQLNAGSPASRSVSPLSPAGATNEEVTKVESAKAAAGAAAVAAPGNIPGKDAETEAPPKEEKKKKHHRGSSVWSKIKTAFK